MHLCVPRFHSLDKPHHLRKLGTFLLLVAWEQPSLVRTHMANSDATRHWVEETFPPPISGRGILLVTHLKQPVHTFQGFWPVVLLIDPLCLPKAHQFFKAQPPPRIYVGLSFDFWKHWWYTTHAVTSASCHIEPFNYSMAISSLIRFCNKLYCFWDKNNIHPYYKLLKAEK